VLCGKALLFVWVGWFTKQSDLPCKCTGLDASSDDVTRIAFVDNSDMNAIEKLIDMTNNRVYNQEIV